MGSLGILFWFVLGLVVGSFLNVILARYGQGDFIRGRSRCPYCKKDLRWYDLAPLVSFITLRGRCRYCRRPISWRYPLVELLVGAGFAASFLFAPSAGAALWLSIFWALSVLIAFYDGQTKTIPDSFLIVALVWVMIGAILFNRDTIEEGIIGAILFGGFFLLLHIFSAGRWIGGGDAKVGFILGFWLGWPLVIVGLLGSYLIGLVATIPFLFSKKLNLKSHIAFGPFIIVASWLAFFWGEEIIRWYLSLVI